jgi:hypothetical protein
VCFLDRTTREQIDKCDWRTDKIDLMSRSLMSATRVATRVFRCGHRKDTGAIAVPFSLRIEPKTTEASPFSCGVTEGYRRMERSCDEVAGWKLCDRDMADFGWKTFFAC